jgi:hypothetical protein
MIKYELDKRNAGHDLSTAFTLGRPGVGDTPTRVFVPIFWSGLHDTTFLRSSALKWLVHRSPA